MLDQKKQWGLDQKNLLLHQRSARKAFREVLDLLKPITLQVKGLFPGSDVAARRRRSMAWGDLFKQVPEARTLMTPFIGTEAEIGDEASSLWGAAVKLLRGVSLGVRGINETLSSLDDLTMRGFQAIVMAEAQSPIREALPAKLRRFLPENIVVEVDQDGYISRMTDRFENERLTLGVKVEKMKLILTQYNDIVRKVKEDLKSSDEVTHLSALVTAIIMETGIRPGAAGNAAIEVVDGEEVEVETFGAVTLGPGHVRFVRDNFAAIEFVGKMGSVNTTSLSDVEIIKVLDDYVQKALKVGSKFIFVTADGVAYTYADLQRYFRYRFKGISPTDFRKLKATDTVLGSLRKQQEALYAQIRALVAVETEDLKERVVDALVQAIETAIAAAATALSHDDASTTRGHYINPQVLLRFLSTGVAAESLRGAVLEGKTRLAFDPMRFVQVASARAASTSRHGKATLQSMMEELERDLHLSP